MEGNRVPPGLSPEHRLGDERINPSELGIPESETVAPEVPWSSQEQPAAEKSPDPDPLSQLLAVPGATVSGEALITTHDLSADAPLEDLEVKIGDVFERNDRKS